MGIFLFSIFSLCNEGLTSLQFTRSLCAPSLTEHNKSALTDHATQENRVINWSQATVIDRAFYQVDQRGHTHLKGRTTSLETVMRAATN